MTKQDFPTFIKIRFWFGQLVATPGAIAALKDAGQTPFEFLSRHVTGDWGEVCAADAAANELALRENSRLLSTYRTSKGVKLWLITEADRSATTLLLPEEY